MGRTAGHRDSEYWDNERWPPTVICGRKAPTITARRNGHTKHPQPERYNFLEAIPRGLACGDLVGTHVALELADTMVNPTRGPSVGDECLGTMVYQGFKYTLHKPGVGCQEVMLAFITSPRGGGGPAITNNSPR